MALSKQWVPWAVKLHTKTAQSGAAVYPDGITEQSLTPQLASLMEFGDGSVYNTYSSQVGGQPAGRFSTSDLKKLLDECGTEGMAIDSDGSHPGVVLYFQKVAEGGTRVAAATGQHVSLAMKNGLLALRSLELPHQGTARIMAEAILRQSVDGVTAPFVSNEADTLPAGIYPTVDLVHTMGPVEFNSVAIDGLSNVSVDFGLDVAAEGADGDIYPTLVYIRRIQPRITFTGAHIDILSTLTEDGKFYNADEIIFYARKRDEGGTYVANGTAEHIKFTLGKSRVDWDNLGGDPASISLTATPYDTPGVSPDPPMTIATASAIT